MVFTPLITHAQLEFTFSPNPLTINTEQNASFDVNAYVANMDTSGQSYTIDSYALAVTNGTLNLPYDLLDDPTNFMNNFQTTIAPGESVNAPFLNFTVGPDAPIGNYTINVALLDSNSVSLANQSFDMNIKNIQPVPESKTVLLLFPGGAFLILLLKNKWRKNLLH